MAMTFYQTAVTIDGQSIGTLDPDDRTTGRCAWSPAVIRWGYSDTMAEPEPSTLQLQVTVPDGHPLPRYGQRVVVSTFIRGTAPGSSPVTGSYGQIFAGNIDGARRRRVTLSKPRQTPVVEGWAVELTASGPLAKLARTNLADNPWPNLELSSARLARILTLLGPEWTITQSGLDAWDWGVRGRDVDNFPALEAIRRTAAGRNHLLVEKLTTVEVGEPTQGLIMRALDLANVFARAAAGGQVEIRESSTLVRPVSASLIVDEDRDLDVGSVINSAAIRYEVPTETPGEYSTRTHVEKATASIETYGESQWRIDSDVTTVPDPIRATLRRIVARRAAERWTIAGPLTIDLTRWPRTDTDGFRFLLPPNQIGYIGRMLHITDAPPDIEPPQRVIGGAITLHGDPTQQRVQVYLEPPDASLGTQAISIYEMSPSLGPVLINETQNVTIADAGTVSRLEYY